MVASKRAIQKQWSALRVIGAEGVWHIKIAAPSSRLGHLAGKQSRLGKIGAPIFIGRVLGADWEGGGIPSVYELKAGIAKQMRDIGDALIKAGDYKGAAAFYNSSTEILQSVKPEDFEKPAIEVDPDELGPDEQIAVLNTLGVTEASGQPGGSGEGSGSGTAGAEGSPSGGVGGDGGRVAETGAMVMVEGELPAAEKVADLTAILVLFDLEQVIAG